MFQGRPMLLVRSDSDCPLPFWIMRSFIKLRCLDPFQEEFCGLAGWIPPVDPDALLNYAWFLKRSLPRCAL